MVAVLVAPRTLARRCASCHDDLGRDTLVCPECHTALHAECRLELRRCPSLGCRSRAREPRVTLIAPGRGQRHAFREAPSRLLSHPVAIGGAVALMSAATLFALASSEAWGWLLALGFAHTFVLASAFGIMARRRRARDGFAEIYALPILVAFGLQVVGAPLVALAGYLGAHAGNTLLQVAGLAMVVAEPLLAGAFVALATGGRADDAARGRRTIPRTV